MKLILVLGPRSSGTRYLARYLVECGAAGDSGHLQRLDALDPWDFGFNVKIDRQVIRDLLDRHSCAVLRRSLPHGNGWPDFDLTLPALEEFGLSVDCALVLHRDLFANAASMIAEGHENEQDKALDSMREAYRRIYALPVPTFPVTYERLGDTGYLQNLFSLAGIELPVKTPSYVNRNSKHYTNAYCPAI